MIARNEANSDRKGVENGIDIDGNFSDWKEKPIVKPDADDTDIDDNINLIGYAKKQLFGGKYFLVYFYYLFFI